MSGIVGIVNLDGAPVDRELLSRMTDFMAFRGPDAQEMWIDGNAGFGHTMLRTTFEAETEKQPLTLDGKVWLTADARIDGRAELIGELEGKLGRRLRLPVPSNGDGSLSNGHGSDARVPNDAELILYAYEAWGEDCVKHLIGDFAFAIWDGRQRRLFCARDHFGIRPFYYAYLSNHLLFSNTLKCLRLHSSVSSELNDAAVGDFLLFDMNYNLFTTAFADIQRLPPAHSLIWSQGKPRLNRYWTLPVDGRIRYKRSEEYVEHFKQFLDVAVGDRLRTNRVGILMSGGLDSTAVAATARSLLAKTNENFDLQAYTTVYQTLIPDKEGYYAGLAAQTLKIPINYQFADDYKLFQRSEQTELRRPEPIANIFGAMIADQYGQIAANCRVALNGHGPDATVSTFFPQHISLLMRKGRWLQTFLDVASYPFWNRRLPPVGFRTFLQGCFTKPSPAAHSPRLPAWLNPKFVASEDLEGRFDEINARPQSEHDTHPVAYNLLSSAFWTHMFERDHADYSLFCVENRSPFFDLRLITYLLAIPTVQWCIDKRLMRAAMKGLLPETIRLRSKSPLAADVISPIIQRDERPWRPLNSLPELNKYVRSPDKRYLESCDPGELWGTLHLFSFYDWITSGVRSQQ